MKLAGKWSAVIALVGCVASQAAAAETFESLAVRIPEGANALVMIDVEQTMKAPLAVDQGWARKLEAAYVERPVFLPPEAKKLLLGANFRIDEGFTNTWEAAVMELMEPAAVRAIARSESGYVDEVNGLTTAVTPADAAFVDFGNNVLGVVRPSDRQFLSRWIGYARENSQPELSEYLRQTLPLVNDRVQVLLAVDLSDAFVLRDVEKGVAESKSLENKQEDAPAIAEVLKSVRGAALRLAIGKTCEGQLQVDFAADVAPLKNHAKPLVLETLAKMGFQTDELAKWDVKLSGRSIRMQGPLSTDAQRRIFSVIELPAADLSPGEASPGEAGQVSVSETRERSLTYFKSTQSLVSDLRKGLKDASATSAWMERYARRIDELPVLHVDEMLIDYGDKLAETLRIMSVSKRQAGIRYGVRAVWRRRRRVLRRLQLRRGRLLSGGRSLAGQEGGNGGRLRYARAGLATDRRRHRGHSSHPDEEV